MAVSWQSRLPHREAAKPSTDRRSDALACSPIKSAMVLLGLMLLATRLANADEQPKFFRGLNLNGPPVVIDGQQWEGKDSKNYECPDKAFENQNVPLVPETDQQRALMLRSSRWGGNQVTLKNVPTGRYSVFLYVWEDNDPETFSIALNGREVLKQYRSGPAGHWERLGPWFVTIKGGAKDGELRITSKGGAANFSGIEVWRGEHDGSLPSELTAEGVEFFERRVRPLLVKHCYECHSAESKEIQGELLVDSRQGLRRGGSSGPAVVSGDVERSLLIKAVRHSDPDLKMPPESKLTNAEIADLEQWIRMKAPDPRSQDSRTKARSKSSINWDQAREFWSLKPVKQPTVPPVKKSTWPASDMDRFLLSRLEAEGLQPAADADKLTLIRRVTFDLIGLPPTPAEIDAFVADQSPEAFRTVIERLLKSPQYGERWGRYWLDVVRYADTAGDNSDFPIPQMYRYRNWVIDAFNRDLPYDQFVRDQLAGDLIGGGSTEQAQQRLIATGYIANARRFGSRVDDYPQHLTIEDTLDNLGRTFLATTVNCARCHHHKFDPITTDDYYALYGIFQSTRYPWPGIELEQKQRDLVPLVSSDEVQRLQAEHKQRQEQLEADVSRLEKERKTAQGDARKELDKRVAEAKKKATEHSKSPLPFELAYAVAEGKHIDDAAIQIKGDPAKLGPVVPRRFLTVLNGQTVADDDSTSGRRALAEWIVDPANPLTARVMVNRIWLHHFGKGLVPTPNDFGRQGKPPTHPELLDWLATRFIESGWAIKELHRTILLSRAYRMSSQRDASSLERDPSNELLSAFPRRRLDAEAIRDTLLQLGGNLDPTPGGPHPFPPQSEWKFTQHNPFKAVYDTRHRSVYLMTQRIQRHPYLAIFDGADPSTSTPQRLTSTTPLQALYLLNDAFVHEQAAGLAQRLLTDRSTDNARIELGYRLTLGRSPTKEEFNTSLQLVSAVQTRLREASIPDDQLVPQSWQALCRALCRTNEFVYVD